MLILYIIQQHKCINTEIHTLPSCLPVWYCHGFCESCLTFYMYVNISMFSTCWFLLPFHLIPSDSKITELQPSKRRPWLISIAILISTDVRQDRPLKIKSLQCLHNELLLFSLVQLQSHWFARWSVLFLHHFEALGFQLGVGSHNGTCPICECCENTALWISFPHLLQWTKAFFLSTLKKKKVYSSENLFLRRWTTKKT